MDSFIARARSFVAGFNYSLRLAEPDWGEAVAGGRSRAGEAVCTVRGAGGTRSANSADARLPLSLDDKRGECDRPAVRHSKAARPHRTAPPSQQM